MNTKFLIHLRKYLVISVLFALPILLILFWQFFLSPQKQSNEDFLTLTVRLQHRGNYDYKLCTRIEIGKIIEHSWKDDLREGKISALLFEPEKGTYKIKFTVTGNQLETVHAEMPKLKLDKPHTSAILDSKNYDVVHKETLILSRNDCE